MGEVQDPIVEVVRHVDAAAALHHHPRGAVQVEGAAVANIVGSEVRLAKDGIGARAGTSRGRVVGEVQHPVVARVRHVDAAVALHHHPRGLVQAGIAHAAVIGGVTGEGAILAIDGIGARAGTSRGRVVGEVQHPVVARVRHVDAAATIHHHPRGLVQAGGAHATVIGGVTGEGAILAIDGIGARARMSRSRVVGEVQHPVVVIVRHVDPAIAIHRHPSGHGEAGSAHPAHILDTAGERTVLPIHHAGGEGW
jgi:hypothetical protein